MLGLLMLALRTGLTLMGALALLYAFSYPDALLPPSPDVEYVDGFTIYKLKPILWVIPVLFMEIADGWGSKRNAVWFFSLGAVFVAALAAWPVLLATQPEWVYPTLPFEDGKLAVGLCYYALFILASVVFRCVLLAFLFHEPRSDEDDPAALDSAVLDPSRGRTVQAIQADPPKVAPRFLFGDADQALIDRFRVLMHKIMRMKKQRNYLLLAACCCLVMWFFFYPQPSPPEALQRDKISMLEYRQLPDGSYRATRRAAHAAYRVLKHISDHELFAGMSLSQAEQWLGLSHVPEAYRKQLLDSSDISLPSVDDLYENRTRFFTVQDGKHSVVLYIRTNQEGDRINVCEVQDAGWNAVMDERRRRFGQDISSRFFSK